MKGLFVSAYKLILDGYKPKAHPNGSINSRFYRSPLTSESPKQLKARFPQTRPKPRVPGKRADFPRLPLSPSVLSPDATGVRPFPAALLSLRRLCSSSGALESRRPSSLTLDLRPPPKQSGGPCPPRGGAAPLALSSTRSSKQASSIQKQSNEHRRFHVPPDLRMLVCRCRV